MKSKNIFVITYMLVIVTAFVLAYTDCMGKSCSYGLISNYLKPIIWTVPGVLISIIILYRLSPEGFIKWTKFIFLPTLILGTFAVVNQKFFGGGIFTIDREIIAFWFSILLVVITFLFKLKNK